MWLYRASAVSNFGYALKASYYTHRPKLPDGPLSKEDKARLVAQMNDDAIASQYHYHALSMPLMFRHKSLIPISRLQSWWQNYLFTFWPEMLERFWRGETRNGFKLSWSERLGVLRYLLWGYFVLQAGGYSSSFLLGAAPRDIPPTAKFIVGLINYARGVTTKDKAARRKTMKLAERNMVSSLTAHIPGYYAYRDVQAVWNGTRSMRSLLFYGKSPSLTSRLREAVEPYLRGKAIPKTTLRRIISGAPRPTYDNSILALERLSKKYKDEPKLDEAWKATRSGIKRDAAHMTQDALESKSKKGLKRALRQAYISGADTDWLRRRLTSKQVVGHLEERAAKKRITDKDDIERFVREQQTKLLQEYLSPIWNEIRTEDLRVLPEHLPKGGE